MSSYQSGQLRHQLTFQVRSTTQDAAGGESTTWTDAVTTWGDVASLTGREMMAAQAVNIELSHTITIRYKPQFADPKVVAAMRVLWVKDGITRLFNIQSASDDDERRKYMILMVYEGLNDG